jgi:MATE family multidrug resistance protein
LHKSILTLSIPNIISNITIPLSASIDIALMGHLSAMHLGAIALGSMIFTFIYGSFNFLRMGTTGMVAQSYGKGEQKAMSLTLYRALLLALIISFLIVLFQKPIIELAIYLLNAYEYEEFVRDYFDVRIYAVFGAMLNFTLIGFFFGVSNSMIPLFMTVTINLSNTILSYLFVYKFDMGISGVALGTLISQYLGLAVGLYYLKKEFFLQRVKFDEIVKSDKLLRFFKINRDIFIRTITVTTTLSIFYSLASKNSTETLAIATILMQFMTWMAYAIDGFANAGESLVGKYFGAKDRENFFKAVLYSVGYGFFLALIFSMVYLLFARELLELFTSDSLVIEKTLEYKLFLVIFPIVSFLAFIFDGIMIGMTEVKVLRDSVLVGFISFLGSFYILKSYDYEFWLMATFGLFFLVRGLYQLIWFRDFLKGVDFAKE